MPPQFASDRDSIFRMDRTFRSLFANPKAKLTDAQSLIDSMNNSGVDASVCAGFGWTDPGVARESNNYNIEVLKYYHFVSIAKFHNQHSR